MHKFYKWMTVAAACAVGMSDIAAAGFPLPTWYGESNTTRQGYTFTKGNLTPVAEILQNPYQPPMATITLGYPQ
jgi:hypothetical protein